MKGELPDPSAVRLVILLGPPYYDVEWPSKVCFQWLTIHTSVLRCTISYGLTLGSKMEKSGMAFCAILRIVDPLHRKVQVIDCKAWSDIPIVYHVTI